MTMETQILLKSISRHMLDLVFPVLCLGCGKEGSYLCSACNKSLKRDEFQICPVCASKSPFGTTHPKCKTPDGLDGLISAVPYKEKLARKLVECCKYKLIKDITPLLAKFIAEEIANQELNNYLRDFTLVPLPLHATRLKWRGFNQSEEIGKTLSMSLNIPMRTNLIARRIKTKVQAELKDEERKINVLGAFIALENLENKKIAIIDDVSTTRSTLTEACKALKSAGAKEVWGLVFAQG